MAPKPKTYRLYLAAKPIHGFEGIILGFLLVRAHFGGGSDGDAPPVISVWPSTRTLEGRDYIRAEYRVHRSFEVPGVRALMVLDYNLPPGGAFGDNFDMLETLPLFHGHVSTQYLSWSRNLLAVNILYYCI